MTPKADLEGQYRLNVALGALFLGALFVGLFTILLPRPEAAGELSLAGVLFGRQAPGSPRDLYPLTIQNLMWLVFFVGLGELWLRFVSGAAESRLLAWSLLPEDETSMLRAKDLSPIYAKIMQYPAVHQRFLPRLVRRIILQFQGSKSIDQANSLLNSSLGLMQHEIDLRYNQLRYIMWFLPTLGFIGTVVGIAFALADASVMPDITNQAETQAWLAKLTNSLGIAFNTTLMALLMAAVLVLLMHVAQGREESALNEAGQYCLDNLINRLYED
jgi:biopolymer transport protein ExbB/TolQ